MKHYRQFPIINPEWDEQEELENLKQDNEHDWDDPIQDTQFHNAQRWADKRDRKYNKETE